MELPSENSGKSLVCVSYMRETESLAQSRNLLRKLFRNSSRLSAPGMIRPGGISHVREFYSLNIAECYRRKCRDYDYSHDTSLPFVTTVFRLGAAEAFADIGAISRSLFVHGPLG